VRVDRQLADVGDQQRVAVGRRSRDDLGARDAAGTGPVLDHDLLAECLGHLRADDARHRVGQAARRVRHDHPDRPGGKVLRLRRNRQQANQKKREPPHRSVLRRISESILPG